MTEVQFHLGRVNAAESLADLATAYDAWAPTYDADMARFGYRHLTIGMALLARHLPKGEEPILDAGVGTGLAGPVFDLLGWPGVWGMDLSQGMLDQAAGKGLYANLVQGVLGQKLAFADNQFAGVLCAGVFSPGHAGPEALPELLRVLRPGGVMVLTVHEALWQTGFAAWIAYAEDAAVIEMTPSYDALPGQTPAALSRAIALRRL